MNCVEGGATMREGKRTGGGTLRGDPPYNGEVEKPFQYLIHLWGEGFDV
jgi:hypothetical protein